MFFNSTILLELNTLDSKFATASGYTCTKLSISIAPASEFKIFILSNIPPFFKRLFMIKCASSYCPKYLNRS